MENPTPEEIAVADNALAKYCLGLHFNDRQSAMDLVQQTWERALANIAKGNYRPEGSLNGWVCKIASRLFLDNLRKAKRMPTNDIDNIPVWLLQPSEPTEPAISDDVLLGAVNQLPPKMQQAIYLHYWEEMKDREIGEQIGTQTNTVRTRIFRGREILRERLASLRHG